MKTGEKYIRFWTHLGEHGKGWEKDRDWSNKGDYEKKNCNTSLCSFKVNKKWVGWQTKHSIWVKPKLRTAERNPTKNASLK